ncbi:MAG: hypothetical protein V4497_00255 [Bacteroidota bacterium]
MIDSSECVFFLNTPNSITPNSTIDKTASPWIFSEIATTQIIRKKIPQRITKQIIHMSKQYSAEMKNLNENFRIEYDLELSHLTNLTADIFTKWIDKDSTSPENALDNLYSLIPLKTKLL